MPDGLYLVKTTQQQTPAADRPVVLIRGTRLSVMLQARIRSTYKEGEVLILVHGRYPMESIPPGVLHILIPVYLIVPIQLASHPRIHPTLPALAATP